MKIYKKIHIDKYLQDDWLLALLQNNSPGGGGVEDNIRTHQWLMAIEGKRCIYADVYGELLQSEDITRRVLDVGGGVTALTKLLAQNSDYTLLDFLAHDHIPTDYFARHRINVCNEDWYCFKSKEYDIVIANDIFPDVDQRMELFIEKFLPYCREIRLVITFYNTPRFYTTKRVDDTEIMTFLSWDGEITAMKLNKYIDRMIDTGSEELYQLHLEKESIFRNGRHVAYVRLRGDL